MTVTLSGMEIEREYEISSLTLRFFSFHLGWVPCPWRFDIFNFIFFVFFSEIKKIQGAENLYAWKCNDENCFAKMLLGLENNPALYTF